LFIHRIAILCNSYRGFICTLFWRKKIIHSNLFLQFFWFSCAIKQSWIQNHVVSYVIPILRFSYSCF
jgi:hypothetical protein